MLEEQLIAARQARRQRSIGIAVSVIVIVIVCAAILMFTTSCCGWSDKDTALIEEIVASGPTPAAQTLPTSTPVNTAAREDYLTALNTYRNDIAPALALIDLPQWAPDRTAELEGLKGAALDAFAAADYRVATNKIRAATALAETLIEDSREQYTQALMAANEAYLADDYEQAKQQIERALMLDKLAPEALTLAADIAALGNVLPLLQQARVARTENNAQKELAVINEILKIAPDREVQRSRKQQLVNEISLNNFQRHINSAYAAISKQDAATASKHIASAKAVYPNRAEIKDVSEALQALQKQQRLTGYSKQALAAMREDNWQQAKQQLTLALSEQANDKTIKDLLSQTETILSLTAQIEQHLANPYRLASTSTKANANELLLESESYRAASPRLAQKASELSALIDDMSKKVSVQVLSDNKTNVLVRGVGIVGVIESKTIELPPGQYKFEGKRAGYKSKLIEVLIPYDKSSMQLTVVCDEPI